MDQSGSGEIGYDEFTLLSEERWQVNDPYKLYQEGLNSHSENMKKALSPVSLRFENPDARNMGIKSNDAAGYQQLETMAKHHLKRPLRIKDKETGFIKINRNGPEI